MRAHTDRAPRHLIAKTAAAATLILMVALGSNPVPAAPTTWFEDHTTTEQQAIVNALYNVSPVASQPYGGAAATLGDEISDTLNDLGKLATMSPYSAVKSSMLLLTPD